MRKTCTVNVFLQCTTPTFSLINEGEAERERSCIDYEKAYVSIDFSPLFTALETRGVTYLHRTTKGPLQ